MDTVKSVTYMCDGGAHITPIILYEYGGAHITPIILYEYGNILTKSL